MKLQYFAKQGQIVLLSIIINLRLDISSIGHMSGHRTSSSNKTSNFVGHCPMTDTNLQPCIIKNSHAVFTISAIFSFGFVCEAVSTTRVHMGKIFSCLNSKILRFCESIINSKLLKLPNYKIGCD